jgi:DNA repair and recombination RAD54-like protein
MRRSLAPSQHKLSSSSASSLSKSVNQAHENSPRSRSNAAASTIIIQRLPIIPFLSIPDNLCRSFTLPKGCILTEESIALRRVKTLGGRKSFQAIRPGEYKPPPLPIVGSFGGDEDDAEAVADANKMNLPPFEPLILWQDPMDPDNKIEVIPSLACKLRPHQREGVQFLFECTMGLRGFEGNGCLLADDMGLGKTLMSITVMWTLLQKGFKKGQSAVRKVMVVCPTSLVGNWENEIRKWVGDGCNTFAVKGDDAKRIIENYINYRGKGVLIISYETQRRYSDMFTSSGKYQKLKSVEGSSCCDLLICDEAHKLKNAESGLAKALNCLPAKMRILLSGTPMQNELQEFYNMINFCNPGIVGSTAEFRRKYERPILQAREPGASDSELKLAQELQNELSTIVNEVSNIRCLCLVHVNNFNT